MIEKIFQSDLVESICSTWKKICQCIHDEPHQVHQVLLPEDAGSHVGEPIDKGIQQLLHEVMVA